jgi:hypothetical protein
MIWPNGAGRDLQKQGDQRAVSIIGTLWNGRGHPRELTTQERRRIPGRDDQYLRGLINLLFRFAIKGKGRREYDANHHLAERAKARASSEPGRDEVDLASAISRDATKRNTRPGVRSRTSPDLQDRRAGPRTLQRTQTVESEYLEFIRGLRQKSPSMPLAIEPCSLSRSRAVLDEKTYLVEFFLGVITSFCGSHRRSVLRPVPTREHEVFRMIRDINADRPAEDPFDVRLGRRSSTS